LTTGSGPPITAFADVVTPQVAPTVWLGVAVQPAITGNGRSITVAASGPPVAPTPFQ
jgi:hypothetical protein